MQAFCQGNGSFLNFETNHRTIMLKNSPAMASTTITRSSHSNKNIMCRAADARKVDWPTGLEKAIVDGIDSVGGGLGNHLRNQGVFYYDRNDLSNLLPSLEKHWQALPHTISIPEYAQQPFHVWHGHSNWPSAANSEAVMSMFAFMALDPTDQKNIDNRMRRSRELIMNRVMHAIKQKLDIPIENTSLAVDLGCGAGQPTNLAAAAMANARVIGIDASPYMVSWAQLRNDPTSSIASKELSPLESTAIDRVELRQGLAEDTGLEDSCADVVMLLFVAHELPLEARRDIFKEAHRILRPGGVFAVVDHTQEGSFPWQVFDTAKQPGWGWLGDAFHWLLNVGAPEPWLREFYENSIEDTLNEIDFDGIEKIAITQWQHAVVANK